LVDQVDIEKLQKDRHVQSVLLLDYKVYGDKNTSYKKTWGEGKGVRRGFRKLNEYNTNLNKDISKSVIIENKYDKKNLLSNHSMNI